MRFKLLITVAMLLMLLLVGSFGVIAMSNHHHESGCPFMPGEQAICDMTPMDHIGAWQNTFAVTIPTMAVYLLFAAVLLILRYHSPPDLLSRRLLYDYRQEHLPIPLYQELFSSGILNPRAP